MVTYDLVEDYLLQEFINTADFLKATYNNIHFFHL